MAWPILGCRRPPPATRSSVKASRSMAWRSSARSRGSTSITAAMSSAVPPPSCWSPRASTALPMRCCASWCRRWRARRPQPMPRSASSDAVGAQRRKPVEPDRCVARGVGAGREDLDLVADFEAERQPVLGVLVKNIGAVAGRPGQDYRSQRPGAPGRLDAVFDALPDRLGEAVELADIEINPALAAIALVGDQHHLALDQPGVADQGAAGLDDDFRQIVAEMPGQRRRHRLGVLLDSRDRAAVARRKAAADIDHAQVDVGFGEQGEHARGGADRAIPLAEVGLLRADVERDAVRIEAELASLPQ